MARTSRIKHKLIAHHNRLQIRLCRSTARWFETSSIILRESSEWGDDKMWCVIFGRVLISRSTCFGISRFYFFLKYLREFWTSTSRNNVWLTVLMLRIEKKIHGISEPTPCRLNKKQTWLNSSNQFTTFSIFSLISQFFSQRYLCETKLQVFIFFNVFFFSNFWVFCLKRKTFFLRICFFSSLLMLQSCFKYHSSQLEFSRSLWSK